MLIIANGNVFFVLSILSIFLLPSEGILCYNCASNEDCSRTDVCEGDYCMSAFYAPKLGKYMHFGQPKTLTGCLTGNLIKKHLVDHCEKFGDESELVEQNCMCGDKNFCNDVIHEEKFPVRITRLVKCQCSDCGSSKTCFGEYCTIMTDENKKLIQSCSNRSLPLLERNGDGSCMMPPISPNFVHTYLTGDHLKQEVCLCSEDYCNAKLPSKNMPKVRRDKCKMMVNYDAHALKREKLDLGECEGEYCFKVKINDRDMKINYEASGCLSYMESRRLSEELNDEGCFNFTSTKFEIKACFESSVITIVETEAKVPQTQKPSVESEIKSSNSCSPMHFLMSSLLFSFILMFFFQSIIN